MPTQAEALTDAFRAAEARRAALVAAAVALYWQQRVSADDPESVERWLAAMVPLILRERNASAVRGVLFGNTIRIPIIGMLFKNTNKTREQEEMLVFITPRIVPLESK